MSRLLVVLCLVPLLGACTARYSQSLAGRIPQSVGSEVRSSATGFSLFNIAINEPTSALDQVASLMGACSELTGVQVDYRELVFLIIGIPRVTVRGTCVK